jgi:hypothetical protein
MVIASATERSSGEPVQNAVRRPGGRPTGIRERGSGAEDAAQTDSRGKGRGNCRNCARPRRAGTRDPGRGASHGNGLGQGSAWVLGDAKNFPGNPGKRQDFVGHTGVGDRAWPAPDHAGRGILGEDNASGGANGTTARKPTRDLLPRIVTLCSPEPATSESVPPIFPVPAAPRAFSGLAPRLVVSGVSMGGPAALETLLPDCLLPFRRRS